MPRTEPVHLAAVAIRQGLGQQTDIVATLVQRR